MKIKLGKFELNFSSRKFWLDQEAKVYERRIDLYQTYYESKLNFYRHQVFSIKFNYATKRFGFKFKGFLFGQRLITRKLWAVYDEQFGPASDTPGIKRFESDWNDKV